MWRRTKSLRKKSNWEVIHRSLRFNNQAAFGSGAEMLLELIEKNMHFSLPSKRQPSCLYRICSSFLICTNAYAPPPSAIIGRFRLIASRILDAPFLTKS
jgi:hypothetical protein